ncbi:hypothetical protein LF919_05405 [Bifidobacterium pseudolongum]|uniref:hypothetical protein n=1 Tax=Bifidobacterium pseudolongum TaxID=1694 RepID=UPI001F0EC4C2|nr:hypothetical protein [Bifidobacterium pseudolongum]MCH4835336.1 hypothetical protein [Bifidobacterium pseudolongum]
MEEQEIPWRESDSSLCCRSGAHDLFWYPKPDARTVEEAFERYVLPKFHSPFQAARAMEDFLDTLDRARRGILKPVREVRVITPTVTKPWTVFEIKNNWDNTQRSARRSGYVGSRLFHGEPEERPNSIVATWLMVKLEDVDDEATRSKQTGAAKQAAFRLDECERHGWSCIEPIRLS